MAVELQEFFEYIYGDTEGYVYLALKNPENGAFLQHHFKWPEEADKLVHQAKTSTNKYEVYYAPALFTKASARKEDVLGSRVAWVEFDGKLPNLSNHPDIPEPTLRIRSSDSQHEHWYWNITGIQNSGEIERINRALAYLLGADVSGWDSCQILRPPGTLNHKRENKIVSVVSATSVTLELSEFAALPSPPPVGKVFLPEELPDLQEVIAKYKWPKNLFKLFREGPQGNDRSAALMHLGYGCAEAGMGAGEALAVLLNADSRWGKFANRDDQILRLSEIITKAKAKYPDVELQVLPAVMRYGFLDLLRSDIKLEWVWTNLLQESGYFLLSGPPGVGKTLFSLNFAIAAALGTSFLNQPIPLPRKIGYYSLEMPAPDLKHFIESLAKSLSDSQMEILQQNLILLPFGEPLYLTDDPTQKMVEEQIGDEKFDGVIFDSMMAATEKSVTDEVAAKELMDWNDRLRKRTGTFTWYVHHQRKDQVGNKKPKHLGDVYGNVVVTARTTTAFCLWKEDEVEGIDVVPLKIRLAATPQEFKVYRTPNLNYTLDKPGGLTVATKPELGENGEPDGSVLDATKSIDV